MPQPRNWYPYAALAIFGSLFAAAVVNGAFQARPDLADFLFGTTGAITLGVGIATVIFLAINARTAVETLANSQRSLAMSQRADVMDRFQKASEMLGSGNVSAETAAITLIVDCVKEDTSRLAAAGYRAVRDFVGNVQVEEWRRLFGLFRGGGVFDETWPNARASVTYALRHLGQLFEMLPEDDPARLAGRLEASRIVMCGTAYRGAVLENMSLTGLLMSNLVFEQCTFRNCSLGGTLGTMVMFDGCTLENVSFKLLNIDRSRPEPDNQRLAFNEKCTLNNVTINDHVVGLDAH
jgi:hypothetical protein